MTSQELIEQKVLAWSHERHGVQLPQVQITPTRKDQEGDLTVMIFPMLRSIKGNPVALGQDLGGYLKEHLPDTIASIQAVQGFLNLTLRDDQYATQLQELLERQQGGAAPATGKRVMVEFSSPNTNKPLHLGHIRNILLGDSVSSLLQAVGHEVNRTQIINDRGIHICKSMVAWKHYGNDATPASTGLKGDKLVGEYYVKFDQVYKQQVAELIEKGQDKVAAEKVAPILQEAQSMLRDWEAGRDEVVALWKKMNGWVYDGFDKTYDALRVQFDSLYYESNTYILGKAQIQDGLDKGVFYKKDDGSVWIDLTEDGLDEKIVQRSDGTAVYMTQDIGTAIERFRDHNLDSMVYTVGNEQDYHFKVLFMILGKLGFDWASELFHLSYGMVDLPSGKMKSREGTVVDADDLIQQMVDTARQIAQEQGRLDGLSEAEKEDLYHMIGLGALKYYILKVDPKKRILFDPKESVDFQGNTGPFIQYAYARIQSILRKAADKPSTESLNDYDLNDAEKAVIKALVDQEDVLQRAAQAYSPALVANYLYDLVREFNSLYQQHSFLQAETDAQRSVRLLIANSVGKTIKRLTAILGIQVPNQM